MTREQAINTFWSSFGIPAYDENSVPTGDDFPELPIITYSLSVSNFLEPVIMTASVWYRSKRWDNITEKAEAINDYIGVGGIVLECDNGKIWLKRSTPFMQRMSDPDDTIRRIHMIIEVEYFTAK